MENNNPTNDDFEALVAEAQEPAVEDFEQAEQRQQDRLALQDQENAQAIQDGYETTDSLSSN